MQNVSNISITGMLIMYLLAGLFGYLTFYGRSKPCSLQNFPSHFESGEMDLPHVGLSVHVFSVGVDSCTSIIQK